MSLNYQLYPNSSPEDLRDLQSAVFRNRQFDSRSQKLNSCFALHRMEDAVKVFLNFMKYFTVRTDGASGEFSKGYTSDKIIDIVVDCDVDGYCSSAILYRFLREVFHFPKDQIHVHLHSAKQHGLSADIPYMDFNGQLVLIPDAGSNDVEQCTKLFQMGKTIIVLDHHLIERLNSEAIVVNNQLGEYPNKALCGTGVTWQFIAAVILMLDKQGIHLANYNKLLPDYASYVAIATFADIVNVTTPENQYFIQNAITRPNPFFDELKRRTSIRPNATGYELQFGAISAMNALIRIGTQKERELLFQALCQEYDVHEKYNPRKGITEDEDIYEAAAKACVNAKARQKRIQSHDSDILIRQIEEKHLDQGKLIVVDGSSTNHDLTGLLANAISSHYQKPCLVLNKCNNRLWQGSGRNVPDALGEDLRSLLLQTGKFQMVEGHGNAFGCKIATDDIPEMLARFNTIAPDVAPERYVDFVDDANAGLNIDTAIAVIKHILPYCGQGFKTPVFVYRNLCVMPGQIQVMGKGSAWKIVLDPEICVVKFNVSDGDAIISASESKSNHPLCLNVMGTYSPNYWNGQISFQFIVDEYEVCSNEMRDEF